MAIINGYENGLTLDREKDRTVFQNVNPHVLAFNVLGGVQEHHTMAGKSQKLKFKNQGHGASPASHSTSSTRGGTIRTGNKISFQ